MSWLFGFCPLSNSITEDDVNEMTEEVKNEISKKLRKK